MKLINSFISLLLVLLLAALIFSIHSCTVTKSKQSKAVDSAHTIHADSVSVSKKENKENNNGDWERQIVIYNRDTTINHYFTKDITGKAPVINVPKPSVIIYERGAYNLDKQYTSYDSLQNERIDSLKYILQTDSKDKKEQSLSFWLVVGIAVVVSVIFFLIGKLKISIK